MIFLFYFLDCVHKGLKEYVCDHCGRGFNKSGNLKTHIRNVHLGLKIYKCEFCDTAYGEKRNLENHIDRNHPGMKKHSKQIQAWNRQYMEYLTAKGEVKSEIMSPVNSPMVPAPNMDTNNRYSS